MGKTSGKSRKVNSRGDHKWEMNINAYIRKYQQRAKTFIMPKYGKNERSNQSNYGKQANINISKEYVTKNLRELK